MTADASNRQIVLVVEDDPMLRGILAEALAGEGHAVLTAATGEEALAIAGPLDGRLDLVVTDVLLPHIDGMELADHLAGLSSPPAILFISGVKVDAHPSRPGACQAVRAGGVPRAGWPDARSRAGRLARSLCPTGSTAGVWRPPVCIARGGDAFL